MIWNISLTISILILISAVVLAVTGIKVRGSRIRATFQTVFAGVFLAVYVGLVPVIMNQLTEEPAALFKLVLFDVLQTIQVFISEVSGDFILENISIAVTPITGVYSTYMTCLFFVAPILTFGFVLSLFRNAWTTLLYRLRIRGDIYIFSELNDKALMLANSIRTNHKKATLIFADVDRNESEIRTEYLEEAEDMGALMFRKDIVSSDFGRHNKSGSLRFFAIGKSESDNLILSLKLIEKYRNRPNTDLYVFSSGVEGDMLLANADKGEVKVRRVNGVRSLIYRFLYDSGIELFESAAENADGTKQITAVVAGLGQYGTEIVKALAWYGQMDGYRLAIHGFDADPLAEEIFAAQCPELMRGDEEGELIIHAGVDVRTRTFAEELARIGVPTYIFVTLGDDEKNISQSANIRTLCERMDCKPKIRTVIYSTAEKNAVTGITNYRGQAYDIEAIGDRPTSYSEEVIIDGELEKLALACHLKWGAEEEFWQYEYNYHSSMALAIHRKARILCHIPGAEKTEDRLTEDERTTIARLEHRRWNAYMRSEGYVGSGSTDRGSRNDLAKIHPDILSYDDLPKEERRKLTHVGTL